MENSHGDSGLIKLDDDNQAISVFENVIYSFCEILLNFTVVTIHYLFLPVVLMYSFWAHAQEQMWKITKHISFEIYELMHIVPLLFEACFWSARCFFEVLFVSKSKDEIAAEVEENVYKPLKTILVLLKALPFSYNHATALYSILIKVPIFGVGRLPFPNFLFEDTFTKVDFQKGTVTMTIAQSESSQFATETQTTSGIPASAMDQSKPAIKKKPSRFDDKVKFDLSVDKRPPGKDAKSPKSL